MFTVDNDTDDGNDIDNGGITYKSFIRMIECAVCWLLLD